MAIERERKYLVDGSKMGAVIGPDIVRKVHVACYFTKPPEAAVRVTYSPTTGKGKMCIKSGMGESRLEVENTIPYLEAVAAAEAGPTKLIKIRYDVNGFEIDCFLTMPLWLAEWEVGHNGNGEIAKKLPEWVIKDVTDDPSYTNQALAWKYGKKS